MSENPNVHKLLKVEHVVDETPTVRTIIVSDEILYDAQPGQFCMVWVPGVAELPMSIMVIHGKPYAAFTVRKHGSASTALYNIRAGDNIGYRGPYGNSFTIRKGSLMLVGGGTGLVPLMRLVTRFRSDDEITVIMGSKTKDEILFERAVKDLAKSDRCRVVIVTEDGSYGSKGLVTDVVKNEINSKYDAVYTCGPEMMMYNTIKIAHDAGVFAQASVERVMKCGMGVCGSCCMSDAIVCKDGTIFDAQTLLSNADFGHTHRDKSGIPVKY
ncbi:MAG: dihydroorotate dehydrogenase electron transfer subunit [Cenarchaeum symbiont of Oopsacas minuta]|nr:dihydroorotate dehydrogenase electron transfer subunit [Cenarchaeum symbiont of Oopsacas minuta]